MIVKAYVIETPNTVKYPVYLSVSETSVKTLALSQGFDVKGVRAIEQDVSHLLNREDRFWIDRAERNRLKPNLVTERARFIGNLELS